MPVYCMESPILPECVLDNSNRELIKTTVLQGSLSPDFGFEHLNKRELTLDFNKYLDKPLLLITEHKTNDLKQLLSSNITGLYSTTT